MPNLTFYLDFRAVLLTMIDIGDLMVKKRMVQDEIEMASKRRDMLQLELQSEVSKLVENGQKASSLKAPDDYKQELLAKATNSELLRSKIVEEKSLNDSLSSQIKALQEAKDRMDTNSVLLQQLKDTDSALRRQIDSLEHKLRTNHSSDQTIDCLRSELANALQHYETLCAHLSYSTV